MIVDIIVTSFAIWALAFPTISTTCGLRPVGTIFPVAGIVRATSGRPDADTITVTVLGSQEQIECAVLAVADATTVQIASQTYREALRATIRGTLRPRVGSILRG